MSGWPAGGWGSARETCLGAVNCGATGRTIPVMVMRSVLGAAVEAGIVDNWSRAVVTWGLSRDCCPQSEGANPRASMSCPQEDPMSSRGYRDQQPAVQRGAASAHACSEGLVRPWRRRLWAAPCR